MKKKDQWFLGHGFHMAGHVSKEPDLWDRARFYVIGVVSASVIWVIFLAFVIRRG